jgi:hypothetical protein
MDLPFDDDGVRPNMEGRSVRDREVVGSNPITPTTSRIIGIVGHAAEKFTPDTEAQARAIIRRLLTGASGACSGESPMGGIDVWAREEAVALGVPFTGCPPTVHQWAGPGGFMDRNLQIARISDEVYSLVVKDFPPGFRGKRYPFCYHCKTAAHIKSGGCWTVKQAAALGKHTDVIVIGA